MRKREIFTVSLPREMLKQVEQVRKAEHRTRSELVREALRKYIREADMEMLRTRAATLRAVPPQAEEVAAVEAGTRELASGKHRPFKQLRDELLARRRPPRRKKP